MTAPALVTGASSGLGREVAVELARRDVPVILLARDAARLDQARREVEAAGGRARVAQADVRDGEALRRALDAAAGDEPLGLLVHAAGILRLGPLQAIGEDDLRAMLDVNLVGAVATVRAALPRLERAHGRIVLISSIAGKLALPDGFTGYGASKWALRGWAEIARHELEERGVGLTVAYPSILDTSMVAGQHAPGAPAVYRAFPWHSPASAARRILDDAARGRRESYLTFSDRLGAWAGAVAPAAFHAAFRRVVRVKAARAR